MMQSRYIQRLQVVLFLLFCFLVPVSQLFPGTFSQSTSPAAPTTQDSSRHTFPFSTGAGGSATSMVDVRCGKPVDIGKQDFGWKPEAFSPLYRTGQDKDIQLCDTKNASWAQSFCTSTFGMTDYSFNTALALKSLDWPADLLQSEYLTRPICHLDSLSILPPPPPNNPCVVGAILWWGGINVCDIFHNLVVIPVLGAVTQFLSVSDSFMWTTPAQMTYNNPNLLYYWNICLWLANSLFVLTVSYAGLRLMISYGNWLGRANVLELLPRLLFAFLAAHSSRYFIQIWIDGNNALCSIFQNHTILSMITTQTSGFVVVLQLLYGVMLLLLLFQAMIRLSLLMLIMVLSPLWMLAWALPETESIGRFGVTATIGLSLTQCLQLLTMQIGVKVLLSILQPTNPLYFLFNLSTGIGLLYVTFLIPIYIDRVIFRWSASLSLSAPSMPHFRSSSGKSGGEEE